MCTIVLKGATRIIKAEIAIIAKSEKKKGPPFARIKPPTNNCVTVPVTHKMT